MESLGSGGFPPPGPSPAAVGPELSTAIEATYGLIVGGTMSVLGVRGLGLSRLLDQVRDSFPSAAQTPPHKVCLVLTKRGSAKVIVAPPDHPRAASARRITAQELQYHWQRELERVASGSAAVVSGRGTGAGALLLPMPARADRSSAADLPDSEPPLPLTSFRDHAAAILRRLAAPSAQPRVLRHRGVAIGAVIGPTFVPTRHVVPATRTALELRRAGKAFEDSWLGQRLRYGDSVAITRLDQTTGAIVPLRYAWHRMPSQAPRVRTLTITEVIKKSAAVLRAVHDGQVESYTVSVQGVPRMALIPAGIVPHAEQYGSDQVREFWGEIVKMVAVDGKNLALSYEGRTMAALVPIGTVRGGNLKALRPRVPPPEHGVVIARQPLVQLESRGPYRKQAVLVERFDASDVHEVLTEVRTHNRAAHIWAVGDPRPLVDIARMTALSAYVSRPQRLRTT